MSETYYSIWIWNDRIDHWEPYNEVGGCTEIRNDVREER